MADTIRAQRQPEPDVDDILQLAAIIRKVDGNNSLGAAALAEEILSHPHSRWTADRAQRHPQPASLSDEELWQMYQGQGTGSFSPIEFARAVEAATLARAALSQPEPAGLSDEELLQIAAKTINPYEDCGIGIDEYEAETECAVEAYGSELIAFARAVEAATLARAQRQPVPVSERLPGPGDCTSQGWCWVLYRGYSTWTLESPFGQDGQPTGWSHWLPAHALPLPGEVEHG